MADYDVDVEDPTQECEKLQFSGRGQIFWSMTIYQTPESLLIANPLNC